MIVAAGVGATGGRVLMVGLTEADILQLRKGRTKTKEGSPEYGFSSLVVFLGKSDQEMIELLSQAGTVRRDDLFPNVGGG
ncbi:MAG: hypothetical protein JNG90_06705 [Planctomycetaceae bacterium]|nr:hypothetical protein [Planctomycetaceae bacterium]